MSLTLRPNNFHSVTRADYHVLEDGKKVGRIYSGAGILGRQWKWALDGIGSELAESFDDAKAKLQDRLPATRSARLRAR